MSDRMPLTDECECAKCRREPSGQREIPCSEPVTDAPGQRRGDRGAHAKRRDKQSGRECTIPARWRGHAPTVTRREQVHARGQHSGWLTTP